MNSFYNLLYPDVISQETETVMGDDVIRDIGFSDVKIPFKNTERYYNRHMQQLNKVLTLEHAILYRQEILRDFMKIPGLREEIGGLLPDLYRCVREYEEYKKTTYDQIRDVLWRAELFGLTVQCLSGLSAVLCTYQDRIRSIGLKDLMAYIKSIQERPEFIKAKESLPSIREETENTGTFSLNVHFNIDFNPYFTTVTKPRDGKKDTWTIAKTLFGVEDQKQTSSIVSKSLPGLKTLYDQTFQQEMITLSQKASIVCQAFSEEDFLFLMELDYGFDFYLAAMKFMEYWNQKGIDLCLPIVCPKEENTGVIKDMTDLGLAYQIILSGQDPKTIVKNNCVMDDESRIYILTGANNGGKTTFVRGVGVVWMLFQNGLPAPVSYARLSPVTGLFTHFPKEEAMVYGKGHLGNELSELKEILKKVNKGDLVLLNESLSGTSMEDSLSICSDYVKVLSETGVKCIFATHLHPLSSIWEDWNKGESVVSPVGSLVAVVEEETVKNRKIRRRTYRIKKGVSDGESYAGDLAEQYGLSDEYAFNRDPISDITFIKSESFSLLHKELYSEMEIEQKVLTDLGMDLLIRFTGRINLRFPVLLKRLKKVPKDKENILYRQEIFRELMTNDKLAGDLTRWIHEMTELEKNITDKYNELPDHRRRIKWKINSLELYLDCLDSLHQILQSNEIKSEGLLQLKELIQEKCKQDETKYLREILPDFKREVSRLNHIKIGVRFNHMLMPEEIILQNIGGFKLPKAREDQPVRTVTPMPVAKRRPFLQKFYRAVLEDPEVTQKLAIKKDDFNQDRVFLNDVKQFVDQSLMSLSSGMDSYLSEHGGLLLNMASELSFYTDAVLFFMELNKVKIPVCKPDVTEDDTVVKELCDMATGLYLQQDGKEGDLVPNDVDFSHGKRVFILTGPNQGGKTTYMKAMGMAQIFFQGGLYVPAKKAEMAPVHRIATHFLKKEERQYGEGRLGEELRELSQLLHTLTNKDLLLTDEAVSGTCAYDGLIVAKKIIKSLRKIGVKTVYSTHLHELTKDVASLNESDECYYKVVPLFAGIRKSSKGGTERTFKIHEGISDGRSYAVDVVEQQGMNLKGMRELVKAHQKA